MQSWVTMESLCWHNFLILKALFKTKISRILLCGNHYHFIPSNNFTRKLELSTLELSKEAQQSHECLGLLNWVYLGYTSFQMMNYHSASKYPNSRTISIWSVLTPHLRVTMKRQSNHRISKNISWIFCSQNLKKSQTFPHDFHKNAKNEQIINLLLNSLL